jgi:hypothetical protein
MARNSVALIDKDLAAAIEHLTNRQLRAVATAASRFALDRTRLTNAAIKEALNALELGKLGDSATRAKLESLVKTLDEKQWRLQEIEKQNRTSSKNYIETFQQARAASSLYFALHIDPFVAATNAIYESFHATNDLAGLKAVVLAAIAREK